MYCGKLLAGKLELRDISMLGQVKPNIYRGKFFEHWEIRTQTDIYIWSGQTKYLLWHIETLWTDCTTIGIYDACHEKIDLFGV